LMAARALSDAGHVRALTDAWAGQAG